MSCIAGEEDRPPATKAPRCCCWYWSGRCCGSEERALPSLAAAMFILCSKGAAALASPLPALAGSEAAAAAVEILVPMFRFWSGLLLL